MSAVWALALSMPAATVKQMLGKGPRLPNVRPSSERSCSAKRQLLMSNIDGALLVLETIEDRGNQAAKGEKRVAWSSGGRRL
jgi:hypothetical protein